jgi:hypothetical protein
MQLIHLPHVDSNVADYALLGVADSQFNRF